MDFKKIAQIGLILAWVIGSPAGRAEEDVTPAQLVEFSFAPATVNVSVEPATVTLTLRITDDLSGFSGGYLAFRSASGQQWAYAGFYPPPVSGDLKDGTYQGQMTIPQHADEGTWVLDYIYFTDRVGNATYFNTAQLQERGFPTTLTVTSVDDTTPAVLVEFSFSPTSVDASQGPATVAITLRITDELSGFSGGYLAFRSPSGQQWAYAGFYPPPVSGDVYQSQMTIPQYADAGTWTLDYIYFTDRVGNATYLTTSQLQEMGFPTTLSVSSVEDTTPAALAEFDFSPDSIDTSQGPATVTVTLRITDDLSGFSGGYLAFRSPTGQQWAYAGFYPPPLSGDANDGVYQGQMTIPQYADEGVWTLAYIYFTDRVGNATYLETAQLEALSFPTQLVNGPQFIEVQIDIKPGSFPNSINLGSGGTVPVAILSAPAFDATSVDPTSVILAGAGVALKGKGTSLASFEDVNGDGLADLVVHVSTEALQLTEGDTVATLEARTFDGKRIRGSDSVRVVP